MGQYIMVLKNRELLATMTDYESLQKGIAKGVNINNAGRASLPITIKGVSAKKNGAAFTGRSTLPTITPSVAQASAAIMASITKGRIRGQPTSNAPIKNKYTSPSPHKFPSRGGRTRLNNKKHPLMNAILAVRSAREAMWCVTL